MVLEFIAIFEWLLLLLNSETPPQWMLYGKKIFSHSIHSMMGSFRNISFFGGLFKFWVVFFFFWMLFVLFDLLWWWYYWFSEHWNGYTLHLMYIHNCNTEPYGIPLKWSSQTKTRKLFWCDLFFSHFILPSQLRVAALLLEITRFYISIFRFFWKTVEFRSKHEHYAYFRLYIKNQQVYCNIDWWLYALGRAKMAGERERKKK